jgi:hypothetical protein
MLVTISCIVISITAFSVTKKPEKKTEKKPSQTMATLATTTTTTTTTATTTPLRVLHSAAS